MNNIFFFLKKKKKKNSIIREVPDNQEVYVDINTDQSIIVELLEQAEASNDECGLYAI